jgi:hypothetical protein
MVTAVFFFIIPSMLLLQWVSFRDMENSMESSADEEGGSMHTHGGNQAAGGEDGRRREADEKELDVMKEAIQPHHPINRMQCGSWVEDYARLHREVLAAGPGQGRYAVMVSRKEWENGLADRLASSLSVLLYAILTRRVFLYDWGEGELAAPLWSGLRSDFIDWRAPSGWENQDQSTLTLDYVAERNDEREFLSFFQQQDLLSLWEDYPMVVFHTDHCHVQASFDNPHLKEALASLGLKRETAFACLFDFLYRPTREAIGAISPQLPMLLSDKYIKIGIQIRVGDWQLISQHRYWFHPQNYAFLFEHYFDCAKQIEIEVLSRYTDPRMMMHQRLGYRMRYEALQHKNISKRSIKPLSGIVWYLLADTGSLRQKFGQRYGRQGSAVIPGWGRKIVVNTQAVSDLRHVIKDEQSSISSFYLAVGELWSFSLVDHHILTRKSGFGKVGAMLASKEGGYQGTIFSINYPMQLWSFLGMGGPAFDNTKAVTAFQWTPNCRSKAASSIRALCFDYTGC